MQVLRHRHPRRVAWQKGCSLITFRLYLPYKLLNLHPRWRSLLWRAVYIEANVWCLRFDAAAMSRVYYRKTIKNLDNFSGDSYLSSKRWRIQPGIPFLFLTANRRGRRNEIKVLLTLLPTRYWNILRELQLLAPERGVGQKWETQGSGSGLISLFNSAADITFLAEYVTFSFSPWIHFLFNPLFQPLTISPDRFYDTVFVVAGHPSLVIG